MSWIVMNAGQGPLCINELGINLTGKQHFDLDMIGRANAERSNEVKLALQKGWLQTVRKDAYAEGNNVSSQAIAALQEATVKIAENVATKQDQFEQKIQAELQAQKQKTDQMLSKQDQILEEVRALFMENPVVVKTIKEALQNIKIERSEITEKRKELVETSHTKEEIEAQEKIFALKDKQLEKNYKDLGKTLSKKDTSIDESLDALDALGI